MRHHIFLWKYPSAAELGPNFPTQHGPGSEMASSIVWTMFILRRRDGLGFVYFYYFIDIHMYIYTYMYTYTYIYIFIYYTYHDLLQPIWFSFTAILKYSDSASSQRFICSQAPFAQLPASVWIQALQNFC